MNASTVAHDTFVIQRDYEVAVDKVFGAWAGEKVGRLKPNRHLLTRSPLSELEEAAIGPVYRAFRVGMVASEMADGLSTGSYDLAMIERQLSRTATAAP